MVEAQTYLLAESIDDKLDLRLTVEGMLYRMRTGCPWRDLPEAFGPWNALYKRFRAGCQRGKWWRIFKTVVSDPELEWAFMDGICAKAHQHSADAAGPDAQAIGKNRAGLAAKLHLAVDAYGLPIEFRITGGPVHDRVVAPISIAQLTDAQAIMGDKGYDSLRTESRSRGKTVNA